MRKIEWDEIKALALKLVPKIKEYSPDVIIAIAMGGWIPARLLKLHIKADYYSIGCSYYDEFNKKTDKVRITQDLKEIYIKNKKVLLVDEVADSGDTLIKVNEYINGFNPKSVKSAVLHTKKSSKFIPDFTAENISDEWIIYPWEE